MDDEQELPRSEVKNSIDDQLQEEKPEIPTNHRKLLYSALLAAGFLVILGGVSYSIYAWQHHKVTASDVKISSLQQQVSGLKNQLSQLSAKSSSITKSQASESQTLTTSSAPTQQPAVTSCDTDDLSLSLGQPNGAAGTSYVDLILTNVSSLSCTLNGYPTVILVDSQGQQLGQTAGQSTSSSAPTTITLKPDQTAHSTVAFPNPGNFSTGACSNQSTDINLTPSGQTSGLQAATIQQYCPGFSVTAIQSGN